MSTPHSSYKVESGFQLLARLSRKPIIENFYPVLFDSGPKQNEVVEMYSDNDMTCMVIEITCSALLPNCLKGVEAGVLIFQCSGNLKFNMLITCLRNKIQSHLNALPRSEYGTKICNNNVDKLLEKTLKNLYIVEIYDSSQFYITIHNLESMLMEHSNISLVIFDNITAFYWSEQSLKIMKMDTYLKKILHRIQKVVKEHKVTIIYTRPEHFRSSKDVIESLEPCCENPTSERINYRIHIVYTIDGIYQVNIRTYNKQITKQFCMINGLICWK